MKTRLAVLISGRGSNLQSLIDACARDGFPAEIACVISNAPDAYGIERARNAGLKTVVADHRAFGKGAEGKARFEAALDAAIDEAGADLICLAGFMRLLSPSFTQRREGRILNIHPSLLPSYKGLDVHARMIADGVRIAGCTVHFVSAEMDAGPIIGQAAVPVLPDDTPELLAARILKQEHRLYPECVRLVATGEARLGPDGRVALKARIDADAALVTPPPSPSSSP